MTVETVTQLVANPRIVAAVVAVAGLLYWQRSTVVEQLQEQFRWVALLGVGAFLGWSYYSQIGTVLEVIPL